MKKPSSDEQPDPTPLLKNTNYLGIFISGGLISITRWLEMLAVGIYVYESTRSAILVALMPILRMLPLSLCGPYVGAIAERWDRRRMMLGGIVCMIVLMLVLCLLTHMQQLSIWVLCVAMIAAGIFWVLDFPVLRVLLGNSVARDQLGHAISLDIIVNNGSRAVGPIAAGVLLQFTGIVGAFIVAVVLYAASFLFVLYMTVSDRQDHASRKLEKTSLWEGLTYIRNSSTVRGILLVTVIYNLFGFPATSMIPVIGRDYLTLDPAGVGILASMEGVGISVGGLFIVILVTMKYYRHVYVFGLCLGLLAWLAMCLTSSPLLAGCLLIVAGVGAAGFSSMQTALLLLNSPEHLRSRIFGILSVCVGTAPIGFLLVGVLADLFGAPNAIIIISVCGLISIGLLRWFWPDMFESQTHLSTSKP